jgi:hypothetical protein
MKRAAGAAIVFLLSLSLAPQPSRAQASGSTTTAEIGLGIGVLAYLEQYLVALSKSKGSAGQADAIVDAQLPLTQYSYISQSTVSTANSNLSLTVSEATLTQPPGLIPVAPFLLGQSAPGLSLWTLRKLRDLIIYDIAIAARISTKDDHGKVIAAATKASKQANAAAASAEETAKNARFIADLAEQALVTKMSFAKHTREAAADNRSLSAEVATAATEAAAAKDAAATANGNADGARFAAQQARQEADSADKVLASSYRPPNGTFSGWRVRFEHYRNCWNEAIAQPKSAAPSSSSAQPETKPSDSADKPSGGKATEGALIAPGNPCAALMTDYPELLTNLPFDQIDFTASLSDTSLYQQVTDQDVGSHALNDSFHVIFLFMAAKALTGELPQLSRGGPFLTAGITPTTIGGLLSACISSSLTISGAVGCAEAAGGFEQAIAVAQAKHDACAFSRGMWMPKYTSIITTLQSQSGDNVIRFDAQSPPPQKATNRSRIDYGPAPGC